MSYGGKKLRINCGKKHEFEPRTLMSFDSSDIQKLHVLRKLIFVLDFFVLSLLI